MRALACLMLALAHQAAAQAPTATLLEACLGDKAAFACAALYRPPAEALELEASTPEVGAITGLPIDRHDRLVHYVAWQAGAAGFDLWTTGECLARNPRCREGNPLAGSGHPLQIVGLKFAHIGLFAGGANALERAGHRHWAQAVNAVGVLLQVVAGIHNLELAHQRELPPLTPATEVPR